MTLCLSPNGVNVYSEAAAPSRLLVATLDGVAVLERSASNASWQSTSRALRGLHVSCILVEPEAGGVVAGIHGGGLYFSGDDGQSWERRSDGLTIQHVFSLRYADHPGGGALYAGTEPVGLFRSRDNGRTWDEVSALRHVPNQANWTFPGPPHAAHTKTMAFDPRDPNTFYVGVEQGALLKTTDGGASWREIESCWRPEDPYYRDVHQVVLRPSNPDEMFMTSGMGLYHSFDCGASWQHLTGPDFRIGYPDQLILSPQDDRVFMSGSFRDPSTWRQSHWADPTVLRSPDGGVTWEPANGGLPDTMRANIEAMSVSVYPGGFSLFAGTTDGDVYSTDDGGENWTLLIANLPPVSKGGHYRNLQSAVAEQRSLRAATARSVGSPGSRRVG